MLVYDTCTQNSGITTLQLNTAAKIQGTVTAPRVQDVSLGVQFLVQPQCANKGHKPIQLLTKRI